MGYVREASVMACAISIGSMFRKSHPDLLRDPTEVPPFAAPSCMP